LRPGEKLHEELIINGGVQSTAHPGIMRVKEPGLSWARLTQMVDAITDACEAVDSRQILLLLKQAVADYRPGDVVDFLHGPTLDANRQATQSGSSPAPTSAQI
jgi:FlaA1/EpsC-like NDP-sugar epimerase